MKEMRIEETANRVTEAFKKASENAKKTVDALMTDDVKKKLDALEALEVNEKNDDLRDEKSETAKVPTPHEKAAEKLKESVRELHGWNEYTWKDKEVLRTECAILEDENSRLRTEIADLHQENGLLEGELAAAKKTISKMRQEHEAEVRELGDELMEAKAEANVMKQSKDEILKERTEYADALDNDSVAFEAILDLAHIAQSVSQSLYNVSKRIEAETEGRI